MLLLSPRREGSAWSAVNKTKIQRLVETGRMTSAGQEKIDHAKLDGSWDRLETVDALIIPDDLARALAATPNAAARFAAFSPSSRRGILEWILSAKRPETRKKRIAETASLAARNIKANHPTGRRGEAQS
ncbi:MAG: YdeI/OmpD-associated family protein [Elsteraceae bacterium]